MPTTGWSVANRTGNILLVDPSFTVIPTDYVYHLTGPQLEALMADIRNGGDFAFGFDPDCHYSNNGITLTITAIPASTPESPSIMLLGSGLLVSMTLLRRNTRKQA